MTWVNRTIIVPSPFVDAARAACEALAGAGGSGMYTVPLSASGELPATHWASSGPIDQDFADLLANPDALAAVATSAGLDPATLLAVLAASDVSDLDVESWPDTLARLGLLHIHSDPEGFR
ncbi:hypothetical protein GCM10007933_21550 [Zoogloea oryzae]|uniref:Uncharacterized protein n=1 Tax=Zoogloea oryzae TaxID=310767 RepID=A0ABQ6FD81_9RHOO|nr:hypothetical protein [Zoogloea oryzae]GLT22695.1 hypothetical protein GCM10007933_21550 [Zoogloea oryzae]